MAKQLKVLVLTSTFPRWKDDTDPPFVYELSKRLASTHLIDVLAPAYNGATRRERIDGMNVIRFRYFFKSLERLTYDGGILPNIKNKPMLTITIPFFIFFQVLATYRLAKSNNYDVIHAHWAIPQGLTLLIVKNLGLRHSRLLITSHGGDLFSLRSKIFTLIKQRIFDAVDHITVVSNAMKKYCIELHVLSDKISVIPMGVELRKLFSPFPKQKVRENIIYIGRLAKKKGVEVLIKSMEEVVKEFPECVLTIVGDGHERESLEALSEKLDLTKNLVFLGGVSNAKIPFLLRDHLISATPSIVTKSGDQEGFGLTIVEAMGCECVAVASDLNAIQDIIVHGETGFLTKAGDANDLSNILKSILSNPPRCELISKNGREHAVNNFDWTSITKKYSQLYLKMTAEINNSEKNRRNKENQ